MTERQKQQELSSEALRRHYTCTRSGYPFGCARPDCRPAHAHSEFPDKQQVKHNIQARRNNQKYKRHQAVADSEREADQQIIDRGAGSHRGKRPLPERMPDDDGVHRIVELFSFLIV